MKQHVVYSPGFKKKRALSVVKQTVFGAFSSNTLGFSNGTLFVTIPVYSITAMIQRVSSWKYGFRSHSARQFTLEQKRDRIPLFRPRELTDPVSKGRKGR